MAKNKKPKLYIKRKKLYYFLSLVVFVFVLMFSMSFFGNEDINDYNSLLEFDFGSKIYFELYFELAFSVLVSILIIRAWLLIYKFINYIRFNRNYDKNFRYMKEQAITYHICPECGNQTDLKEVFCPHMKKCKHYKKNKGASCFAHLMNKVSRKVATMHFDGDNACIYERRNSSDKKTNSILYKESFFKCKYIDKCKNEGCYFKLRNSEYMSINSSYASIEGEYKKAMNAYLECEKYEKYQRYEAHIKCQETECKYHIDNKKLKNKRPCTLSIKKGVTLGPNIMSPKKLKCKYGKRIDLLFEKNIRNVGYYTKKNRHNANLCIVCNGHVSKSGKNICQSPLSINRGINYTFVILGIPNSGKTSFIMNVFHILKNHISLLETKSKEHPSIMFDYNTDENGLCEDYKRYTEVERDEDELVTNTQLKKTKTSDYTQNFSFSFTDGSYTLNFSDRPGEAMSRSTTEDTEDSENVVLKYTIPNNYNGVLYIYNPYMSSEFKRNYSIDLNYYDDSGYDIGIQSQNSSKIYDMKQFSKIVNNTNDLIPLNKKIAFIFQKTDLFFDVRKISKFDTYYEIILNDYRKIKIVSDSIVDDSLIKDDRNNKYKIQLLEYEIGTFCIRNVQAILYKLRNGISIDENYDMLMNFKTGKYILSSIFAFLLSVINDKRNPDEWKKYIDKRFITEIEDNSTTQTRLLKGIITNQHIIDHHSLENFKGVDLFLEQINNVNFEPSDDNPYWYQLCNYKQRKLNNDSEFYAYVLSLLAKELILSNLDKSENSDDILADPDDIMNFAGVNFCLAYEGINLLNAFYQKEKFTTINNLDKVLKKRRFFTTNAYYKDFAKSKIVNVELNTELFENVSSNNENISVINVDNRTINPVVWILEDHEGDSNSNKASEYIKNIMSNNGSEEWK